MKPSQNPSLRAVVGGIFSPMRQAGDYGDGYPAYVSAAARARMDVNDWIEANLGWFPALPILESVAFPYVSEDSRVCEVGVGTGRWSRHIAKRVPLGSLTLVDKSPWVIRFVREYFAHLKNVRAEICDGYSLPLSGPGNTDLVFSQGLFITLKLGHAFIYLKEFGRILKPGGRAIFDFIDPETPSGWAFLEREIARAPDVFAYHSLAAVSRCAEAAGLEVERTHCFGKSTYLITRKIKDIGCH